MNAKKRQVREYISKHKIEVIGLQETIKFDFTNRDLRELSGDNFMWRWAPANDRSRGILMGVKVDSLEIEECNIHNFCVELNLRNRLTNSRWVMIIVHGPAHHDSLDNFLNAT